MAYRWNGVECDTFEELQRLQGAARTTSAVIKEARTTSAVVKETRKNENRTVREAHGKECECLRCETGLGHP